MSQTDTFFQALAQCENTLTKLGLVREAVDDTAGAAKVSVELLKDVERQKNTFKGPRNHESELLHQIDINGNKYK